MKTILLALSLLAAAVFWSGCTTGKPESDAAVKFVWLDDATTQLVSCTGVQLGTAADGRPKVIAHLHNNQLYRIEVQANCVFLDGQGFTVDESPFRTLILDESATQDVVFEAFNTNAVKYVVRARKSL